MISLLLAARSLRAFADGYVAVLLPAYLLALGYGTLQVGFLSTVTLFGSALATLAVGRWGHRFDVRRLLLAAAILMALTGMASKQVTTRSASSERLFEFIIVAFLEQDGAEDASLLSLHAKNLNRFRNGKPRCSLTENQAYR